MRSAKERRGRIALKITHRSCSMLAQTAMNRHYKRIIIVTGNGSDDDDDKKLMVERDWLSNDRA